MKPGFALSLSFEGITLLLRGPSGWRQVGEVRVDAPNLPVAMDELRRDAMAVSQEPVRCKLVLPNDQIRYLTIETGEVDPAARLRAARAALDGATPYEVDDLAFDVATDGPVTHVAAVAKETLAEAEAFAVEHRFDPVSFVALPAKGDFVGEPFFGETEHAALLLPPGERVDPDAAAITVLGPVIIEETAPEAALTDTPDDVAASAPSADQPPVSNAPPAGFTSRRRRRSADAAEAPAQASVTAEVIPIPAAEATPPRPARPAPSVSPRPEAPRPSVAAPARSKSNAAPVRAPVLPTSAPATAALRAAATVSLPDEDTDPRAGFISRRRDTPVPLPEPEALPNPVSDAERLTVFGARDAVQTRGKPKYLGLILTAALIVVLLGVAAFASIFADDGLARLFGRNTPEPEIAAVPEDAAPQITTINPDILNIPAEVLPSDAPIAEAERSPTPGIDTEAPALSEPAAPAEAAPVYNSTPDFGVDDAARQLASLDFSDPESDQTAAMLDALRLPTQQDEPAVAETSSDDSQPASYAVTGIWSDAPESPETPGLISLDDLYVAAIDGATLTQDALALPGVRFYDTDISLNGQASPAAAGIAFKLDALGLVEPSEDGTVTPDGIRVFLGRPPVVPPPTPNRIESVEAAEPLAPQLPRTRPRSRPQDLIENAERSRLGGLTVAELGGVRPRERPYEPEIATEEESAEPELTAAEARLASIKPKARPRGFEQRVARAEEPAARSTPSAGPAAAASTASTANLAAPSSSSRNAPAVPNNQTARPTAPSPTTVAKQATIKNAINLRQVNLIGVFGTPSNRRALVRLSSGRYKKVKVGDRIDGGQIVAIGDSELRYQKSGRNVVLRMPRG